MQGKKKNPPKLFYNFSLEEYIPTDNFYRILRDNLDLSFIYKETEKYYVHTGRPSLDPVFGSLQQHYGLRWINTRGIESANKLMLMAGAAFNLKKWVKHLVEKGLFPHIWRILRQDAMWGLTMEIVIFRIIFSKPVFESYGMSGNRAFR